MLAYLRDEDDEPWERLMSLHGCDYLPEEPRLGIHYELLSMERGDRLNVRTRVGVDDPHVPTVVDLFRQRTSRSARCTTCSAWCSTATPTCAAS